MKNYIVKDPCHLKVKKKNTVRAEGGSSPIQSSVYIRLRGLFTISKLRPYLIPYYLDISATPTLSIYVEPAVGTQAADIGGKVRTAFGQCRRGTCCRCL